MNGWETSSAGAGTARGAARPIARNLRRWRTAREMTLSALAEQAGVAKSTVSLIEHGHGNPSIDTVGALAQALGVPFASLLPDDEPAESMSLVRECDSPVIPVDSAMRGRRPRRASPAHAHRRRADRDLHDRAGARRSASCRAACDGPVRAPHRRRRHGAHKHRLLQRGSQPRRPDQLPRRPAHSYRAIEGPARLIAVHEYPQPAPGD